MVVTVTAADGAVRLIDDEAGAIAEAVVAARRESPNG